MTEALFGLHGLRALVTGARSGIGAAAAEALAAAGADIVLWGRTADSLADTAERCRAHGRHVVTVGCPLDDLSEVERAAADVVAQHRIDVLVNNAGTITRAPALEVDTEAWRGVLTPNLDALFTLCRVFGGPMVSRGSGSVVNVASLLSFQGGINVAAYTASKHAVSGVTKALANEWAPHGVTVNAVAPGYVATDNTSALRADPDREPAIRARIPAGRWGSPTDLAGAFVFLAGPSARYVTGHTLVVDGGWLAR